MSIFLKSNDVEKGTKLRLRIRERDALFPWRFVPRLSWRKHRIHKLATAVPNVTEKGNVLTLFRSCRQGQAESMLDSFCAWSLRDLAKVPTPCSMLTNLQLSKSIVYNIGYRLVKHSLSVHDFQPPG
jgi:hypothetical protein